jgi:hypothetical protein
MAFDSELSPAVLSFGEKQPDVLRKSSPRAEAHPCNMLRGLLVCLNSGEAKRSAIANAFGHKLGGALDLDATTRERKGDLSSVLTRLESPQILLAIQAFRLVRTQLRPRFLCPGARILPIAHRRISPDAKSD